MKLQSFTCVVLLSVVLLAGCGGASDGPKLYPVKGTLTKGGKGLAGLKVLLETSDPSIQAPLLYGVANEEGVFEIQTSSGSKGAPAGLYKVVVVPPAVEMDYSKPPKGGPKKDTDLVPKNFQSATTTELNFEVKADSGPLEIKIP